MDIEEIAGKLSSPQKRWLTDEVGVQAGQFYAYPPPNTHGVLMRLGLMGDAGHLTPLGLQVRAFLQAGESVTP